MKKIQCLCVLILGLAGSHAVAQPTGFPYLLPNTKPDRPLSVAMQRLYDDYLAPTPEANELYSTFKFTPLEGLDYHNGDGTITRRDPSKVIRVDGKYYVWYTYRQTPTPPRGAALGTDTIPSTDWDLAEIWYATSDDGFTWQEQGVAIHNGLEHNTIQYASDGVSFKIAAVSSLMPVAAGPYVPDAFTDTKDGRGITWGLCHITAVGAPGGRHSILARFDCDLSRDVHDPWMKQTDLYLKPEAYFSQGLSKKQKARIQKVNQELIEGSQ